MKTKPIRYNIGDKIKIIDPQMFVRCGYPLTPQIVKEQHITDEEKKSITDFLSTFGITEYGVLASYYSPRGSRRYYYYKAFDAIMNIIAYNRVGQMQMGGNERTIHTEYDPHKKDIVYTVIGKKVHRTGTYFPSRSSVDYWGEYDYEPGGLANMKTHVILELSEYGQQMWLSSVDKPIKIEQCHVEPYLEEKDNE